MKNKEKWIYAYQHTLKLYENNEHKNSPIQCEKCKLVGHTKGNRVGLEACDKCPEGVFDTFYYGCLLRPNNPARPSWNLKNPQGVIEYHKQAIAFLQSLPEPLFTSKKFSLETFKPLIDIDRNIHI